MLSRMIEYLNQQKNLQLLPCNICKNSLKECATIVVNKGTRLWIAQRKEIKEDNDYYYVMVSTKRTRKSTRAAKSKSKMKLDKSRSLLKNDSDELARLKKENKMLKEENKVFQEYFKVFEKKYDDKQSEVGKLKE